MTTSLFPRKYSLLVSIKLSYSDPIRKRYDESMCLIDIDIRNRMVFAGMSSDEIPINAKRKSTCKIKERFKRTPFLGKL